MSLIVQDDLGTITDAESYITVAEHDSYHAGLGNTDFTSKTTEEKEIACRKATKTYIEIVYFGLWLGERYSDVQNTEHPRIIDGSNVGISSRLKEACAILAGMSYTQKLLEDVEKNIISEKVAVIETKYSEYSDQLTRYTSVYGLIAEYLENSSLNSSKVVRT